MAEWIAKAALGSGLFSALFVAATLFLYGMRERLTSDAWVDVRQAVELFFPVYLLATLTAIFLGLVVVRGPSHRRRGVLAVALGTGSMIAVVVGRSLLA